MRIRIYHDLNDLPPAFADLFAEAGRASVYATRAWFANLEETAPDTYRLTAPLGAKLVIPTPFENTWALWKQGEGRWQEAACEFTRTKSGYLMSVELPISALAEGPVELRLTTGK